MTGVEIANMREMWKYSIFPPKMEIGKCDINMPFFDRTHDILSIRRTAMLEFVCMAFWGPKWKKTYLASGFYHLRLVFLTN